MTEKKTIWSDFEKTIEVEGKEYQCLESTLWGRFPLYYRAVADEIPDEELRHLIEPIWVTKDLAHKQMDIFYEVTGWHFAKVPPYQAPIDRQKFVDEFLGGPKVDLLTVSMH